MTRIIRGMDTIIVHSEKITEAGIKRKFWVILVSWRCLNMSNKKKNFSAKGYYIALVLCAAAIGVSGYLYFRDSGDETAQIPVAVTQEGTLPAAVTKPGNLQEAIFARCQIRRQTKDEDSIQRTSSPSVCAFLFSAQERTNYGKKNFYL